MLDLIFNNKFWFICFEKWVKSMLKISDSAKMKKPQQKTFHILKNTTDLTKEWQWALLHGKT